MAVNAFSACEIAGQSSRFGGLSADGFHWADIEEVEMNVNYMAH